MNKGSSDDFSKGFNPDSTLESRSEDLVGNVDPMGEGFSTEFDRSGGISAGSTESELSFGAGLVSARGTSEGVILRLDSRPESAIILKALKEFMSSRQGFLGGNEVVVEWIGGSPGLAAEESVKEILFQDFAVRVKESKSISPQAIATRSTPKESMERESNQSGYPPFMGGGTKIKSTLSREISVSSEGGTEGRNNLTSFYGQRRSEDAEGSPSLGSGVRSGRGVSLPSNMRSTRGHSGEKSSAILEGASGLFDGVKTMRSSAEHGAIDKVAQASIWDEADTRTIRTTLRSGQKVESEHTVVVLGDVNSGGEVVSGGDIIVLGVLRGMAHAGAYDESGGGRFIFALQLEPTQLRIGSVISRGAGTKNSAQQGPEVARVEGHLIVVEPYMAKISTKKR